MSFTLPKEIVTLDQELYQKYLNSFVAKFHRHIAYGTAGFRDDATHLDHVSLRIGIYMGLVSKLETYKILGIQITASHNPIQDNGIKISDFDGSMIRHLLEKQVEKFVIEPCIGTAVAEMIELLNQFKGFNLNNQGMVFIGQDTRPSCGRLVHLVEQGLETVGTLVRKVGEVTTPMLFHNIWYFNCLPNTLTRSSWTEQFTATYFDTYWNNFDDYMTNLGFQKKEDEHILLDCSQGIGGQRIGPFQQALQKYYNFDVINCDDRNKLNVNCGAEFVHKAQTYPVTSIEKLSTYPDLSKVRVVSYDGDADRIVYFLPQSDLKKIDLLDGDKMISLFALYFKTTLEKLQHAIDAVNQTEAMLVNFKPQEWKIGMVQTPYANGASTIYLREKLGLEVFFSPNGVKNLHPNAHKYDVGIYCESNGHGTFLVKTSRTEELEAFMNMDSSSIECSDEARLIIDDFLRQARQLNRFISIQNQCVGDSITNMLCIEAALATLGMNGHDYLGLYVDLKCKNDKVSIRDKSKLKMSYAEDVILQPKEIQDKLDAILLNYPNTRAFIRPSGTEDIVRLYTESNDSAVVDALNKEVKAMILSDKTIN